MLPRVKLLAYLDIQINREIQKINRYVGNSQNRYIGVIGKIHIKNSKAN